MFLWNFDSKSIKQQSTIDGIIGFSQGASIASIITTNKFKENNFLENTFKNIYISGFLDYDINYKTYYESGYPDKDTYFHIIGKKDKVISINKSLELCQLHENNYSQVHIHNRGHIIPKNYSNINLIY